MILFLMSNKGDFTALLHKLDFQKINSRIGWMYWLVSGTGTTMLQKCENVWKCYQRIETNPAHGILIYSIHQYIESY